MNLRLRQPHSRTGNAERGIKPCSEIKRQKIDEKSRAEQAKEVDDNEAFILDEVYSLWEKNLSDKGFIRERGFSTFISPFAEIIEKRG